MPKAVLTQKLVNAAICPQRKQKEDYFDQKIPGLLLKVMPTGTRTYYLLYRDSHGRVKERRLSCATLVTLLQARRQARHILSRVELGEDPFTEKNIRRNVPTFREFVDDRYLPYIQVSKPSWGVDEAMLRLHILPTLGRFYLDKITKQDIVELISKHRQSHAPATTNRLISVLSALFSRAIGWDVPGIGKNPISIVKKLKENNKRDRYLNECELKSLWCGLERSSSTMLKYIVRMLIYTGARKSEVTRATWRDVDLVNRQWRIETNKSGITRYVPLSDGAVGMLREILRVPGCQYIFPNPETCKPYVNFYHSWNAIRKKAGIPDVRIHDLRHTFASYLVNNGRSIYEVKQVLGHADVSTTQRYAHLDQSVLLDATNTVSYFVEKTISVPAKLARNVFPDPGNCSDCF